MKLTHSVAALLCAAQSAFARGDECGLGNGCVYTYDPDASPVHWDGREERTDLQPSTARLVVAQRAGVEDYHISDGLSEEDIAAINSHGIKTRLFGAEGEQVKRATLFCQLKDGESLKTALNKATGGFFIPLSNSGTHLFGDLVAQGSNSGHGSSADEFFELANTTELVSKFDELVRSGKYHITALVTPISTPASVEWGTYEMPNYQALLHTKAEKRQALAEEPLDELPSETASSVPVIQSTSTTVYSLANQSDPLPGILPACFTSQSFCESGTRNCTGHGSCSLKYKDRDAASGSDRSECWTCMCKASKSEDGKQITYWGGSGCQKEDVSTAFWLLASFTVGMMFLISFAIGTIWSMGNEELPSVIGAGVSGPPRR